MDPVPERSRCSANARACCGGISRLLVLSLLRCPSRPAGTILFFCMKGFNLALRVPNSVLILLLFLVEYCSHYRLPGSGEWG